MPTPNLTLTQITACADLLKQLEPGFLPLEIFSQIARLTRIPTVDLIPVKQDGGKLQIGLIQRPADDQWWPDQWHFPGTVLLSTDTIDTALQRLRDQELQLIKSDLAIFRHFSIHTSTRGAEVVLIHTAQNCQFGPDSPIRWFAINELPANFVDSERQVLDNLLSVWAN
jgi:ADP-ribose pyrophosphatase YjhB (NUDIX family)